jgi:hypothetical protein
VRRSADSDGRFLAHARRVQTYAVYWNDLDGARFAGRLSLNASCAELEGGASDGRQTRQRIAFDDIASVRYERGRLHVWRRSGAPVRLGSVDRPGALRELSERLQSRLAAA